MPSLGLLAGFTLVLATSVGCRPAGPDATASAAAVDTTLRKFSAALAAGDTAGIAALVGPDFALLDEGRVYDLATTLSTVTAALANATMTRAPEQIHTTVRDSTAWSHYVVRGHFKSPALDVDLALLEAAVLERRGPDWKVVLVATMQHAGEP